MQKDTYEDDLQRELRELAHEVLGLVSRKPAGQVGQLDTQVTGDSAHLTPNCFSGKPPFAPEIIT